MRQRRRPRRTSLDFVVGGQLAWERSSRGYGARDGHCRFLQPESMRIPRRIPAGELGPCEYPRRFFPVPARRLGAIIHEIRPVTTVIGRELIKSHQERRLMSNDRDSSPPKLSRRARLSSTGTPALA